MTSFHYEGEVEIETIPYEGSNIILVNDNSFFDQSLVRKFEKTKQGYISKLGKLRILIEEVNE